MGLSVLAKTPVGISVAEFAIKASANKLGGVNYGGDVEPDDAFIFFQTHNAIMVDVRSVPEWQFTGIADVTRTQAKLATICWKNYPDFSLNPAFKTELATLPGINNDTPLFFICRSGGRSLDAAAAMTSAGYRYCFNIAGGFEGDPDAHGHRGYIQGWKAKNLPWKQS